MPTYRVVFQGLVSSDAPTRASRAAKDAGTHFFDLDADSVAEAVTRANSLRTPPAVDARLVSVEELLKLDTDQLTDQQIQDALTNGPAPVDLAAYQGVNLYEQYRVNELPGALDDVVAALRESNLIPGLTVSILRDSDGSHDYNMVEIFDEATGTYRAIGRDGRDLITDRSLTGSAALVDLARTLLEAVAERHLL